MLCILTLRFNSQKFLSSVDLFSGLLRGFVCNNYQFADEINNTSAKRNYVVGSKSFRTDELFKVTEIKQICYFST